MQKEMKFYGHSEIEPQHLNDVVIVKKFGNEMLQIKSINSYPNPKAIKFEDNDDEYINCGNGQILTRGECKKLYSLKCSSNDKKLLNNLSRARNKCLELAYCNDWNFFITLTLDKKKYDRYNLSKFQKDFTHWLRYQREKGLDIKYLLIPERHKNGAWHMHGFISGVPLDHLSEFTLNQKLPKYIRNKLKLGEIIYNFPAYQKKFGFCDFELIKSKEGSAKYILKYITKDLQRSVCDLNAHIYYASHNLQCAEIIAKGHYNGTCAFEYENAFCKSLSLAFDENLCEKLKIKVCDPKKWLEKDL